MANTKSAQKALKQNMKRNKANVARKSMVKTQIKKVQAALESGKTSSEVHELFSQAASVIARASGKDVIHKNTAARKLSRLAKKVNKAQAAA